MKHENSANGKHLEATQSEMPMPCPEPTDKTHPDVAPSKTTLFNRTQLATFLGRSPDRLDTLPKRYYMPSPLWIENTPYWRVKDIRDWVNWNPELTTEPLEAVMAALADTPSGGILGYEVLAEFLGKSYETVRLLPLPCPLMTFDGEPFWSLASIQRWKTEGLKDFPVSSRACVACRFWEPDPDNFRGCEHGQYYYWPPELPGKCLKNSPSGNPREWPVTEYKDRCDAFEAKGWDLVFWEDHV